MKKVIKMNLAAVLALFMTFAFMSFTLLEKSATEQTFWHAITINDSNEDLDIVGEQIGSPEDENTECATSSLDSYRCAVELTYDPNIIDPQSDLEGLTVKDAEDLTGNDAGQRARREPDL